MPKKLKIGIIICVITVILVIVSIVLINFGPMISMTPAETGKIAGTEITAVRNNLNNLFLIKSENGFIAIDTGTDTKTIKSELERLSIDPKDVHSVLITHSDYDHIGSLNLFSNAQLYMSDDELQMVNGNKKRNDFSSNSLPDGIGIESLNLLSDGQKLILGEHSVKCIKTSGHTPGSMSFLVDGSYLFTGDALSVKQNNIFTHPFTMNENEALESIERLYKAKEEYILILTAHYGYYTVDDLNWSRQ